MQKPTVYLYKFCKGHSIDFRLADFYEKSIPFLCRQIESLAENEKVNMLHNLNQSRKFLLQIYNALLHSISMKPLLSHRLYFVF